MESSLFEKLCKMTEEEEKLLLGLPIDIRQYAPPESLIFSEQRLTGGRDDISMRRHPRYAPFPTHSHNFTEIMTVISGSITHFIGKNRINLVKGDILLMNKHISHSIELADTEDIGINVLISDGFLGGLTPSLTDTVFSGFVKENEKTDGEPVYLHFRTEGVKEIENLIENLLYRLTEENGSRRIAEKTLSLLFDHLSIGQNELLVGGNTPRSKADIRKSLIMDYIRDNFPTATLKDLSIKMFLSTPHLSKLIFEYFGKSFKELLIEERLRRAVDMFENSDMPVSAVIRSVGYENESYFHREFKKRFSLTPLSFRNRTKSK